MFHFKYTTAVVSFFMVALAGCVSAYVEPSGKTDSWITFETVNANLYMTYAGVDTCTGQTSITDLVLRPDHTVRISTATPFSMQLGFFSSGHTCHIMMSMSPEPGQRYIVRTSFESDRCNVAVLKRMPSGNLEPEPTLIARRPVQTSGLTDAGVCLPLTEEEKRTLRLASTGS